MAQFPHQAGIYLPIEDYALIGDLHTAALVGKNGSIDWCCLPRFDSPSVFGAILDARKGGFFRISPTEPAGIEHKQTYLVETNVLTTRFLSEDGVVEVVDFMPIKQSGTEAIQHHIHRSIECIRGSLSITLTCRPAFNYARDTHDVNILTSGAIFHNQSLNLSLSSSIPLELDGFGGVQATFTIREGEYAHFVLESSGENISIPQQISKEEYLAIVYETLEYWRMWLSQCTYQGRYRSMVNRSALALKLLTYKPTGAIVAAPTTSLPETLGGARNWDYRYTWLRDAAFTLDSFLNLGFTEEAEAFMGWLDARCHELKGDAMLQPMYGINGEQILTESTLDHLEGYCQSKPVRIGNGAYTQKQLDIYGEMMEAIYLYNNYHAISYDLWQNLTNLLGWLEKHWQEPDEGIWEVRGGQKTFLHSRLMSWVAFDRAIRIATNRGWSAPLAHWGTARNEIYQQIMNQGWNTEKNSFVQYYGSDTVDASVLLMMITGFVGEKEPRMQSTIDCIQQELAKGAMVYRYDPNAAANDGLISQEGTFSACSFWYVENLARSGRLFEARLLLDSLLSYSNHVGLFSEEISKIGKALGNFPQAFTHLAFITACLQLDKALENNKGHMTLPAYQRFKPLERELK